MKLKGLLVAGQYFWLLGNTFVSRGNTFWAGQYFWSSVKAGSRPFSLKLVAVIASPTIMEWVRDKKWNRAIIALVISPSKKVRPWLGEWGGALLMSDHLPFRIPKTISASSCTQILSVSWNVLHFQNYFTEPFWLNSPQSSIFASPLALRSPEREPWLNQQGVDGKQMFCKGGRRKRDQT